MKHQIYTMDQKPAMLSVRRAGIPAALIERPQWIAWVLGRKNDGWTKLPVDCKNGRLAKSNDPTTWAPFALAWSYYERCHTAGIGFVFSPDDPFVGFDLDDVRDPVSGKVQADARTLVRRCNSYAEVSPSGTGLKVIGIGRLDGRCRHKHGFIEVYDRLRYFAVTGHRIVGPREPSDVSPVLDIFNFLMAMPESKAPKRPVKYDGDRSAVLRRAQKYVERCEPAISGQGGDCRTFRLVVTLMQGFALTDSEVMSLIGPWNRECIPPWSEKELQHKIHCARARLDPGRLGEFLRAKGRVG